MFEKKEEAPITKAFYDKLEKADIKPATVAVSDSVSIIAEPEQTSTNESKSDKFKRIAESRVSKILAAVSLLENLASSAYEYKPEQIKKMFDAIHAAADDAEAKFNVKPEESKTAKFSF